MPDMLSGFKQFILRGNVVDLAVGVVIGAAFTAVVNALVADILTPFISAVARLPDFSTWEIQLGEAVFKYGHFLNALISFVIVAAAVYFLVVTPINTLIHRTRHAEKPADPTTKKCPACLSEIPIKATRCAFCTIDLGDKPGA
jgi:large conductance mechanosensitive channel